MLLESFETLNRELGATILMVTHDAFTASYCKRILFIKDGKIFNELLRGADTRKAFFEKIIEVVTLLGGDNGDVFISLLLKNVKKEPERLCDLLPNALLRRMPLLRIQRCGSPANHAPPFRAAARPAPNRHGYAWLPLRIHLLRAGGPYSLCQ